MARNSRCSVRCPGLSGAFGRVLRIAAAGTEPARPTADRTRSRQMSNQGAPPQQRPEDGWWQAVCAGPSGTLPDAGGTPDAAAEAVTVDDWFDSAAGMIGAQRRSGEA